jgi:hypothetical protein
MDKDRNYLRMLDGWELIDLARETNNELAIVLAELLEDVLHDCDCE